MVRVLFVCMGNICRSPTAEGVLRKLVRNAGWSDQVEIDSAGTINAHAGEFPDARASGTALARGYDLSEHRARQVTEADIEKFDYVLAMDHANLEYLREICPPGLEGKLRLYLSFAPNCSLEEVPDPFYGTRDDFEKMLTLIELAARGLMKELGKRIALDGQRG